MSRLNFNISKPPIQESPDKGPPFNKSNMGEKERK